MAKTMSMTETLVEIIDAVGEGNWDPAQCKVLSAAFQGTAPTSFHDQLSGVLARNILSPQELLLIATVRDLSLAAGEVAFQLRKSTEKIVAKRPRNVSADAAELPSA